MSQLPTAAFLSCTAADCRWRAGRHLRHVEAVRLSTAKRRFGLLERGGSRATAMIARPLLFAHRRKGTTHSNHGRRTQTHKERTAVGYLLPSLPLPVPPPPVLLHLFSPFNMFSATCTPRSPPPRPWRELNEPGRVWRGKWEVTIHSLLVLTRPAPTLYPLSLSLTHTL